MCNWLIDYWECYSVHNYRGEFITTMAYEKNLVWEIICKEKTSLLQKQIILWTKLSTGLWKGWLEQRKIEKIQK